MSVACITLIAPNHTAVQYCAGHGEAHTAYANTTASSTSWTTTLTKTGAPTGTLTGSAEAASSASINATELVWTLHSASWAGAGAGAGAEVVRAVDLGFGFVGLPAVGDQHYTTSQSKNWCPPRTGQLVKIQTCPHSSMCTVRVAPCRPPLQLPNLGLPCCIFTWIVPTLHWLSPLTWHFFVRPNRWHTLLHGCGAAVRLIRLPGVARRVRHLHSR